MLEAYKLLPLPRSQGGYGRPPGATGRTDRTDGLVRVLAAGRTLSGSSNWLGCSRQLLTRPFRVTQWAAERRQHPRRLEAKMETNMTALSPGSGAGSYHVCFHSTTLVQPHLVQQPSWDAAGIWISITTGLPT